jgi:hypothetical protein
MTRFSLRALAVIFAVGAGIQARAQQQPVRRRPAQATNGQHKPHRQSLHDEFSGQGFGVGGCGLGSVIFGPKPGLIQIIAVTFNGTAYNQSFGITSGTSNCDIPESGAQAAAFIEVNKEIVRKEAAQGEGETIRALAEIMNCGGEAKLGREVRGNFDRYFAEEINSYETIRRLIASGTCTSGEG